MGEDAGEILWFLDSLGGTVRLVEAFPREHNQFWVPGIGVTTQIGKLLFNDKFSAIQKGIKVIEQRIKLQEEILAKLKNA